MAETMSVTIEDLAKKLKEIFCAANKKNKKYAEVWLSDVDFGGLYHTDKVVVNVRVEHEVESCNEEIKYISIVLFDQLSRDENFFIWRIDVYNSFEDIHCSSDDLLVYTAKDQCS